MQSPSALELVLFDLHTTRHYSVVPHALSGSYTNTHGFTKLINSFLNEYEDAVLFSWTNNTTVAGCSSPSVQQCSCSQEVANGPCRHAAYDRLRWAAYHAPHVRHRQGLVPGGSSVDPQRWTRVAFRSIDKRRPWAGFCHPWWQKQIPKPPDKIGTPQDACWPARSGQC